MKLRWLIGASVLLALSAGFFALPANAVSMAAPVVAPTPIHPAAVKPAKHAKRPPARSRQRRSDGPYGFLPGYRPPHVIAYEERRRARYRPFYALPVPRFYRGRWNGGGFGPCYTYTPIGPVWNCGR